VYFPWPPVKAALSILTFPFFILQQQFLEGVNKTKDIGINAKS